MIKILFLLSLSCMVVNAKTIKIGSGSIAGHYHTLAYNYCKNFIAKNQACEVVQTSGTIENISLLKAHKLDYAIIQSNLLTKDLDVVRYLGEEGLYIFYKNLPQKPKSFNHLMLMVGNDYTFDKKSGTFAIFQKIAKALNYNIVGIEQDIKDKYSTFCERSTKLSIYNISNESFVFQQMILCADYYQFNEEESRKLRNQFMFNGNIVTNSILLVKL